MVEGNRIPSYFAPIHCGKRGVFEQGKSASHPSSESFMSLGPKFLLVVFGLRHKSVVLLLRLQPCQTHKKVDSVGVLVPPLGTLATPDTGIIDCSE